MYYELYNVFYEMIFGLDTALTQYQDLVLNLLSMAGCVAVVFIPFVVVYQITLWISRGFH